LKFPVGWQGGEGTGIKEREGRTFGSLSEHVQPFFITHMPNSRVRLILRKSVNSAGEGGPGKGGGRFLGVEKNSHDLWDRDERKKQIPSNCQVDISRRPWKMWEKTQGGRGRMERKRGEKVMRGGKQRKKWGWGCPLKVSRRI